ncbi:MAG: RluA family pseudouridine synthase [Bacilli bacterium]
MKYHFVIDEEIGFKDFLIKNYSSSFFGYLRQNKAIIYRNNSRIKLNDIVFIKDEIDVVCPPLVQQGHICNDKLNIVYEDNDCIVIDKDFNRATAPSHTHQFNTVYNCLLSYFSNTENSIHFISRLDKDTSGLVLVAKNPLAACLFNKYKNETIKEYIVDTYKPLGTSYGIIEKPIKRNLDNLRWVFEDGHYAKTEFTYLDKIDNLYRYKVRIYTGRTHQIRVHFAYYGSPIVNDVLYGDKKCFGPMHLHAHYLKFYHPIKKEWIELHSSIPF